jgi:hypothetical protein
MSHTISFTGGSTITVYINDLSSSRSPVIAEHQILDATHGTFQYLGSKSYTLTLGFTINSQGDLSYLDGKFRDGYQFVYTDDKSNSGSFICIGDFTYKRIQALNYTAPWYECRLSMANLVSSGSLYYQM